MFTEEPAVILAGIGAILEACIVLAISFGAPISGDQKAALNAFITLTITIGTGILIRGQVVPASHVVASVRTGELVVNPPPPIVVPPPVPPAA